MLSATTGHKARLSSRGLGPGRGRLPPVEPHAQPVRGSTAGAACTSQATSAEYPRPRAAAPALLR